MNRRGFLARLAGVVAAAVAVPFLPAAAPVVVPVLPPAVVMSDAALGISIRFIRQWDVVGDREPDTRFDAFLAAPSDSDWFVGGES